MAGLANRKVDSMDCITWFGINTEDIHSALAEKAMLIYPTLVSTTVIAFMQFYRLHYVQCNIRTKMY